MQIVLYLSSFLFRTTGDYTAFSINLIGDYVSKNLVDKLLELYK